MIFRHHRQNQHPLSGYIEASGDIFLENRGDLYHGAVSDCESGGKMPSTGLFSGGGRGGFGLIAVGEEERFHSVIKRRFLSCLGSGVEVDVAAVHRRNWSAAPAPAQATLMAFQIYLSALAQKNSGNANVRYAWFGTSRAGVEKIIAHGFSHEEINRSPGSVHDRGVYLSPDCSPLQCLESTVEDEDGLRHVLLCRVLLGNVETIPPGSNQTHPSSDCFDSGVDDTVSPKRYIAWSTNMNTHILPEVVVSFRAVIDSPNQPPVPVSPWMSFHALFGALSNRLPPHSMSLIKNHFEDFAKKRIARDELVRGIRRVAGDELLATIIKSCKTNQGMMDDTCIDDEDKL